MAFHGRRCLIVCSTQGPCQHALHDVIRPCDISKGDYSMTNPMSFIKMCCQKEMMTFPTDIVQLCVLSKCDKKLSFPTSFDSVCYTRSIKAYHTRRCSSVLFIQRDYAIHAPSSPIVCVVQERDGMPCPTSSDRVCCPRELMAWHSDRV